MELTFAQCQAMIASSLDAIVVMGADGRIVEFNPAAERTFAYQRSEAVGQPLVDLLIPERFRDQHRLGLLRYLESGESNILNRRVEMVALRSDGSEFPIELTVVPLGEEDVLFAGFVRDISERQRMEGELSDMREELDTVLRAAPNGITVQDMRGRVRYANEAAARIIGFSSPEALIDAHPQEITGRFELLDEHGGPLPWEALPGRRAMAGEESGPITLCWRRRDSGEERWSIVNATPIKGVDGSVRMVVNSFTDITEQVWATRRAEVAARRRAAQYDVSRVLLEAETVEAAAGPVLDAIGDNLGWHVGAFWLVDRAHETLRCLAVRAAPDVSVPRYLSATMEASFRSGEGYPGQAWERGEVMWVVPAATDGDAPRLQLAAEEETLPAAVFIPLQSQSGCVGVVEMLSPDAMPSDDGWSEALVLLGRQVGHFIERRRAQEIVEALSMPVLPFAERGLLVPIVGTLDARRAQILETKLPAAAHANRALVMVIDVTGAAGLDSFSAQALVQVARVLRLLGCRTIFTGISTQASRLLVNLGTDLRSTVTTVDLRSGILEAERLLRNGGMLDQAALGAPHRSKDAVQPVDGIAAGEGDHRGVDDLAQADPK